jgi:hypothetical protein
LARERKAGANAARLVAADGTAAGHGRRPCALLNVAEGEVRSDACQGTTAGANAAIDARGEKVGTRCIDRWNWKNQHVRGVDDHVLIARPCAHQWPSNVWPLKWFAKKIRQVCDRIVGRPCRSAKRYVPKWRCRASAIRRGSAERPQDNSPRPCAESDLKRLNRCVVFQEAASDGAIAARHRMPTINCGGWISTKRRPSSPGIAKVSIVLWESQEHSSGHGPNKCVRNREHGRGSTLRQTLIQIRCNW